MNKEQKTKNKEKSKKVVLYYKVVLDTFFSLLSSLSLRPPRSSAPLRDDSLKCCLPNASR